MVGIYKIINPKGKIYIGSSKDVNRRKREYEYLRCKQQPKIYYSLKKYGWGNHIFEIIEECSIENLNKIEIKWKKHYLELHKGNWNKMLFLSLHDRGGGPKNLSHKRKISKALKGKPKSQNHKTNISNSKIGKKRCQNFINNRAHTYKNKIIGFPILQFDLNGNFIKEWGSCKTASEELNIKKAAINMCLKGKHKTSGGFKWKYKNK